MTLVHKDSEGSVILIDKQLNWTSFDVVKKIRNFLKVKKVGHAGTLDPLATGLLIICTGKKTKSINQYQELEKEYTGTFEIGKTTPSVDLETEFNSESDISKIKKSDILELTNVFKGAIKQTPPAFSAIKIKGVRAYEKARIGEKIIIKQRDAHIHNFEITDISLPEIKFKLVCSKGFYVRSLVRDIGNSLKTGAYLKELRRTRIGDFKVEDAILVEEILNTTSDKKHENS